MTKTIPSAALNQHVAIIGKTGSGKSYAAKGIVEKLLADGRQVCIVDPTGAWFGLRIAADGKGMGFDVVLLGGKHADIPLSARSGEAVARLVTQQRASVVIDTTGLSVGDYTRFFIDFAGTLYTTIRSPLHLVIDEAHQFMPQGKVPDPQAGQMLHAGNRLMSGGRSLGIRGMLITQRPQKLHKDSLTCADTLIAMRVISPQDRAAVKDWIDGAGDPAQGKAILDSLAQLQRGTGYVWYPEGGFLELLTFPKIKTYDSSATPKDGATAGPAVREIKLDEVKAALADAVKEAEANDPKLLRTEIARLRKELAAKPAQGADPKAIEKAVAAAVAAAIRDRDEVWKGQMRAIQQEAASVIKSIEEGVGTAKALFARSQYFSIAKYSGPSPQNTSGETRGSGSVTAPSPTPKAGVLTNALTHRAKSPEAAAVQRPASRASADGTGNLPKGEAAILSACIQFPDGLRREQLTVLTGYKRSSRDAYIQRLREKGFVVANGDSVQATEDGIAALPDAEPLPTGIELQNYWLARLPEGERAILQILIDAYPNAVERNDLEESTGYKRSSRDAYLQRMRAKQLIEEPSRGTVSASENLF